MLFIDEIDSIGVNRNSRFNHQESSNTLTQLLNEMDGFDSNHQVIVVAATNMYKSLDPALLRPNRFDLKIEVKLPELEDRKQILRIHLRNKPNNLSEQQVQETALLLKGFSGAEIEGLVNDVMLEQVMDKEHS